MLIGRKVRLRLGGRKERCGLLSTLLCPPKETFIPLPKNPHAVTPAGLCSVPRTAPLSAMETAEGRSSRRSLDRSPSSCRLGALPATAGNRDIDLARSGGEHVHRSWQMGGERRRRALMTSRCLLPRVRLKARGGGAVT